MPLRLCLFAIFCTLATGASEATSATAASSCPAGYSYAGLISEGQLYGVAATVTATAPGSAPGGHAAAAVNVGGGQAWLQVGITNRDVDQELYYETTQKGVSTFHPLGPVTMGQQIAVAVAAIKGRPGWWRAYANHQAITDFYLANSKKGLETQAFAESYLKADGVCNSLAYDFTRIRILDHPGARWQLPTILTSAHDPGFDFSRRTDSFSARR